MKHCYISFLSLFVLLTLFHSCSLIESLKGDDKKATTTNRVSTPSDISLPTGYKIEKLVSGLNFPTGIAFDDSGKLYVIEAGYSYGEVFLQPKLLRVDPGGKTSLLASGPKNGPWTGITWYKNAFYVAEGGEMDGGAIIKITREGKSRTIISGLPSFGDHHTNGPAIKDDYIYFGQGTATNSGVAGEDNFQFGWLKRKKTFRDIPCEDITLNGENYSSANPLTDDLKDKSITGAYSAFGVKTSVSQVIKGAIPCTGSIMRVKLDGGNPELVAWGFRNPFGLAFSQDGHLYVTENGYDDRGSRPVSGAADVLWEVKSGIWYGWPDFSAGKPLDKTEEFRSPSTKKNVKPLLRYYPNVPPKPSAIFGVHTSANGLDFSTTDKFGFNGEAFVAEFGDMSPTAGKQDIPAGFKVVRVNVFNGTVKDFAFNKGKKNGPGSVLKTGGLERPVAVKFSPDGSALYIVDFGIMKMTEKGPQPQTGTGMIWKITRQ